jgi:hypothetical protein
MSGRLVDYIASGLAAALPVAATLDALLTAGAAGYYYETDTQILKLLNRATVAWDVQTVIAEPTPILTDATTAYQIIAADAGKYVRLTNAAAKTIDIVLDATAALAADTEYNFRNVGAGDATITPVVGVTVNLPVGGSLVVAQGGTVTLKRVATDEFDLFGATV